MTRYNKTQTVATLNRRVGGRDARNVIKLAYIFKKNLFLTEAQRAQREKAVICRVYILHRSYKNTCALLVHKNCYYMSSRARRARRSNVFELKTKIKAWIAASPFRLLAKTI